MTSCNRSLLVPVALFLLLMGMTLDVRASNYWGHYWGGRFGIDKSDVSGAIYAPGSRTFAYGLQGGYLQYGYNRELNDKIVGLGAYADFNAYELHGNVAYGSRSFGIDAKFGLPMDDWLTYIKLGYGYNAGTYDLRGVVGHHMNYAIGAEYKFLPRFRWVFEYKFNDFKTKDDSILVRNRILMLGLNYYYDQPVKDAPPPAPIIDLGPELEEPEPGTGDEPPPDFGSSSPAADAPSAEPETWAALQQGKGILIDEGNFVVNTAKLIAVVAKELDETANFAYKYPDMKFEVAGYTDSKLKKKRKLSLERAKAIRDYLANKMGVDSKRISVVEKGNADPIADNKTKEGQAKNRRVEIHLLDKDGNRIKEIAPPPVSVPAESRTTSEVAPSATTPVTQPGTEASTGTTATPATQPAGTEPVPAESGTTSAPAPSLPSDAPPW